MTCILSVRAIFSNLPSRAASWDRGRVTLSRKKGHAPIRVGLKQPARPVFPQAERYYRMEMWFVITSELCCMISYGFIKLRVCRSRE